MRTKISMIAVNMTAYPVVRKTARDTPEPIELQFARDRVGRTQKVENRRMLAEQLIALAGAHGVDLLAAARMSAPETRAPNPLRRRANGANGKPTRSSARPAWTLAELGQAAAGVPAIPFMAACFAFVGDRGDYWRLHAALFREAQILRDRNSWPAEVTYFHSLQRPYLQHLAKLVLDEDASPQVFRTAPQLFAIYLE
jgi:hypothetical protein